MGPESPSEWVVRWAPLVTRGPVLDVAAGGGRHSLFFSRRNLELVAVDREPLAIPGVECVQADLENGTPWPFAGQRFGAVVVTNYLHRPLFSRLKDSLAESGVLIYETFMLGNEKFGRPSNPAFLLRPGELLEAFGATAGALSVVAFEQGIVERPKPAAIQRICAVRGGAGDARIAL